MFLGHTRAGLSLQQSPSPAVDVQLCTAPGSLHYQLLGVPLRILCVCLWREWCILGNTIQRTRLVVPMNQKLMHTATGISPMYPCSDEHVSMRCHVFTSKPWGLDVTSVSFIYSVLVYTVHIYFQKTGRRKPLCLLRSVGGADETLIPRPREQKLYSSFTSPPQSS